MSDLQKGKENEKRVHPIINRIFQTEFKQTHPFASFDFKDYKSRTELEVKSICYSYGETPEVMIGYNKIKYAMKQINKGWDMWVLFSLNDADYLYNIKEVNTSWIKLFMGRPDRLNSRKEDYYYIPINLLIKVDDDLMIVDV